MRRWSRVALITAVVVLAGLTAFAAGSSARNLSIDETGFEWTFPAGSKLIINFNGRMVRCPVTFAGRFEERTFVKTSARIGRVTGITAGICEEALVSFPETSTPWEVDYESFTGRLPIITGLNVQIIRMAFTITELIRCEYTTTTTRPMRATLARENSNQVTTITPEGGQHISGPCGTTVEVTLGGTGTASKTRTTNRALLTLI